jgi:hypothetical protein
MDQTCQNATARPCTATTMRKDKTLPANPGQHLIGIAHASNASHYRADTSPVRPMRLERPIHNSAGSPAFSAIQMIIEIFGLCNNFPTIYHQVF